MSTSTESVSEDREVVTNAGARRLPPEDRSSRHWIRERLELLDPVEDYAELLKLTGVFAMSDFIMDWSFTASMPRFNLGPSGTAISRGGKGKLFTDVNRRIDDTSGHGITWLEFGPESPQAKRSLNMVNALHAKYQKIYPAEFDDLDLWIYVLAFQVVGMSIIFSDYLGFPEPSEREKIASAVFGKKLAEQFVYIDGRPLSDVVPAMDTYADWVAFMREYESREFAYNQETTDCLNQVIVGYQNRVRLPKFFSRALVTSFWHDGMFRYTGIKPSNRFLTWLARKYLKLMMISSGLSRAIKGDPKESYPERKRREAAESGRPLNSIMRATQVVPTQAESDVSHGTCPMGHGASASASESEKN